MDKPLALVVDDEPQMAGIIVYALETQGFRTVVAYDGEQALIKFKSECPNILVLDVMLPKKDGYEVCREVRKTSTVPVILLTAKQEDDDIIQGLELGADDYITKPFNPREVALRAQAVLRRSGWMKNDEILQIGDLKIDTKSHNVSMKGMPIHLTHNEYNLILCLARQSGRVLSWQSLLKEAWNMDSWEGDKQMVKTAVYRLRHKIEEEPEQPKYIVTVRSVGYTMPEQVEE